MRGLRNILVQWMSLGLLSAAGVAAETPPNILFITADDLNENMGAYGHPLVQTPALDDLAARGVRFDRAYCQWPVCGPSRASFLSGLYPDQTGVKDLNTSIRDTLPGAVTLPQYFMNHGYRSARVGKLYHMSNPNGIGQNGEDDPQSWHERFNPAGVDNSTEVRNEIFILEDNGNRWRAGGWRSTGARLSYLAAEGLTGGGIDKGDPLEHTDGKVATKAVELIADYTANQQPFFLAVGFFKPHTPFVAPKQFFDLYDPAQIVIPTIPAGYYGTLPAAAVATITERPEENDLDPVIARQTIHAYYATISFMDSQIGRVLAALDDPDGDGDPADSIRDNTIVVFLSDHGYHMGEHDKYQKTTLFENSARAPLIISAPGMSSSGESSASLVEMVDLYRTLAELAGLPSPSGVAGKSLAPVLADPEASVRESALTQQGDHYSIRTDRYRYNRWNGDGTGQVELYDHQSDPQELDNLAHSAPAAHAALLAELDAKLDARVAEAQGLPPGDPFPGTTGSSPFGGQAVALPGTIETEDYDLGGEGTAYHDSTPGNTLGGTAYRGGDVDLAICSDVGGGYNVGAFESGEWMAYTVDVAAGIYDLNFRMASNYGSGLGKLEVYLEGVLLGTVTAPASGGWQNWQTVTLPDVPVTPGGKGRKLVLRRSDSGQNFNVNRVDFLMKETGFNFWRTGFADWDPAMATTTGNHDSDPGSNGLEYAFDSDPTDPSDFPRPELMVGPSAAARLVFRRQKFDPNLSYTPKWSTDLIEWFDDGFIEEDLDDLGAVEEVRISKSRPAGSDRLFLKVEVGGL